jgi:hypothetical protein
VKEPNIPADFFQDATPPKSGSTKWILPVIFLMLVPILVAAAAYSSQTPHISGIRNIVLFALTALLCTLVAVAFTLTGCGEWLTRIDRSIRTMATQLLGVQDTQTRLQEAVQKSSGAANAKTLQEEGNRRLVQEGVAQLAGNVQTMVSHLTALGAALQSHREAAQKAIAGLTAGQGQLTGDLHQLQELTQTVAHGLAEAVRGQVAVRGLVQEDAQAMTAATAALQQGQGVLETKLEDVERAGQRIFEAVTGGVAGAAQEQVAVCGLLQENARAVTAITEVIQRGHGTLQAKFEDAARAGRQMVEMVTAMAAEQKAAQETMKRMMEDVTGTGANHVPLGDALRAHGDVINVAVAALAASEGRLTEDVRQIHELTQTLASGMTDAVREQAAAHSSLQQVLTGTTELIHQGQSTVRTRLEDIAGTGRQTIEAVTALSAEQRTGQETTRCTLEEVTGGVRQLHELTQTVAGSVAEAAREQAAAHGALQQALSGTAEAIHQDHNAVQAKLDDIAGAGQQTIAAVTTMAAGQTALHDSARHLTEEVAGVTARQTAFGEALQTHQDATNAGFGALTGGQGQLTGDVRQLHELTQTVAGGVNEAVREQAATHGTLQDKARALTETIQQSQQALRLELQKLAESATQTIEAVNAVAVGQTTGREATRHMIGELANAAIAALGATHGPLPRLDRPLEALAQTMASRGPLNIELPPPVDEAVPAPKLAAAQAIIHGEQMKYEAGPDRDNLGYWANPSDWVEWELHVARPGRFKVAAEIAALASSRFQVLLGDRELEGNAPSTGDYGRFQKVDIGTVEVSAAGKTRLAVRPVPEGWQPMNLRSVELVPLA